MTTEALDESLKGARILVLEDEMMAATMLEMILSDLGCAVVGPAATVQEGLVLAADGAIDAAVLDVNLGGEFVFPVAEVLAARNVPFVFVTGYGVTGVRDSRYAGIPIVQKPYDDELLAELLAQQIAARRGQS